MGVTRTGRALAAALVVAASSASSVAAQTAAAQTAAPPPPKPAMAAIVVDAGTGEVLYTRNDRTALPHASLTKLLTALVAVESVPEGGAIRVSERAAAMPARKVNMRAGEAWPRDDALAALLLSSANDAAAAIAEEVAGSIEDFAIPLMKVAFDLGLSDAPLLQDPAGLDDEFSVGGGNLASARDLAIVGRAVLGEPVLARIVATNEARFVDPSGVQRRLLNHNKLVRSYAGAVGLKTGYTRRSGHSLAAAATREGRTVLAVVVDAGDTYGEATRLLDQAFAGSLVPTGEVLPAKPADRAAAVGASEPRARATAASPAEEGALDRFARSPAAVGVGGVGVVICGLRARALRRQRKRAWRRHPLASQLHRAA